MSKDTYCVCDMLYVESCLKFYQTQLFYCNKTLDNSTKDEWQSSLQFLLLKIVSSFCSVLGFLGR